MVRIKSILAKFRAAFPDAPLGDILAPDKKSETDLMLSLSKFNETVYQTYEQKAPNKLCHFIYELTGVFNQFYKNKMKDFFVEIEIPQSLRDKTNADGSKYNNDQIMEEMFKAAEKSMQYLKNAKFVK